jgi:hypothetical protein
MPRKAPGSVTSNDSQDTVRASPVSQAGGCSASQSVQPQLSRPSGCTRDFTREATLDWNYRQEIVGKSEAEISQLFSRYKSLGRRHDPPPDLDDKLERMHAFAITGRSAAEQERITRDVSAACSSLAEELTNK